MRENVSRTKLIMIDEVSMMSAKDFEQLELVCRTIKNPNEIFGGMQVLASGDFYQLAPVPNQYMNEPGEYCFQSDVWNKVFPHHINLNHVMRQSEADLIQAIRETATGILSSRTELLLQSLNRPLPSNITPVRLFATNYQAQLCNNDMLAKANGKSKEYKATDSGRLKCLNKLLAPKLLVMKKGSPVILLSNLTNELVNGLQGTVIDFTDEFIKVRFESIGKIHDIVRYPFSIHSSSVKSNIATRRQFPLALAYALTIHKAQGMTLSYVEVNCQGIFAPGQLSVAISRARCLQGLHVSGFKPSMSYNQLPCVDHFYEKTSELLRMDLTCCKSKCFSELCHVEKRTLSEIKQTEPAEIPDMTEDLQSDSDFDEYDLELIDSWIPEEAEKTALGNGHLEKDVQATIDIVSICQEQLLDYQKVETQIQYNTILTHLLSVPVNLNKWGNHVVGIINGFMETFLKDAPAQKLEVKHWAEFWKTVHSYLHSQEHIISIKTQFPQSFITDILIHVCIALFIKICSILVKKLSLEITEIEAISTDRQEMSAAGRGKVRYVGGMVVAKVRFHYMGIVKRSLFRPEMLSKHHEAREKVELLSSLERPSCHLQSSSDDPESLKETERRQNVKKSLVNISDAAMAYFMLLTLEIDTFLNVSSLNRHKENLFQALQDNLNRNEKLIQCWNGLFPANSQTQDIFKEVNFRYTRVCAKQFRKDLKDSFQLEKTKAHRKQIDEKREKANAKLSVLNMKQIKSELPELVHLKLKIMATEYPEVFSSREFNKNDILCLCKAYNMEIKSITKKDELANGLIRVISEVDRMPEPEALHASKEELIQTKPTKKTNTKAKSKDPGKGKGKKSTSILCNICSKEYTSEKDWIQCNLCDQWLHRDCCHIDNETWEIISKGTDDWYCPVCLQDEKD